jgi:O-antigen ligase
VLILLVLRSRRKIGLLLAFAAATAPVVYLVRDSYVERMQTITDEDESSISMRLALAKTALEMWKDSPVVGFGFGGRSSIRQAREYQSEAHGSVFHDTYLQVLVDSGVPALVVWVSLLWGTILWLEFSRRKARSNLPHLANIPEAIQLSLIAFAIGSAFLSRVQFDFTYMLLAAAASWGMVYRKEMAALREEAADSVQPATLETAPALN